MNKQFTVVYVTSPNEETSAEIASTLVGERLAACANIVPKIRSIYRWQGKIEDDEEQLLVIKTRADLLDTLAERVRELHPYDVPEVIALPVLGGSRSYLDWIAESTRGE